MAEGTNQQTASRPCPKDCRMCGLAQQVYCATQMCFNLYEVVTGMSTRVESIEQAVETLKSKTDELAIPPKAVRTKRNMSQDGDGEKE